MAIGIRKIRPLTNLKIISAGVMFLLWRFEIATEDFLVYSAALVVFPSLVEVILEVRNFLHRRRRQRMSSAHSGSVAMQTLSSNGAAGAANMT